MPTTHVHVTKVLEPTAERPEAYGVTVEGDCIEPGSTLAEAGILYSVRHIYCDDPSDAYAVGGDQVVITLDRQAEWGPALVEGVNLLKITAN